MLTYVLIHGAGGTREAWDPVTAHLRHPFLAVDLPGRNDKPGDLDTLTVRDFAASVVDDMDARGIGSAVIVGHSLAGLTLVTLAELIPERIAHLVFVNSVSRRTARVISMSSVPTSARWSTSAWRRTAERIAHLVFVNSVVHRPTPSATASPI